MTMSDTTTDLEIEVDLTERSERRGRGADHVHQIPASGWKDIALRLKDRFGTDHVTLASAGVAFFGFLAMVPLIAAGVSIYGLFASPSNVTSLVDRIDGSVPSDVANLIESQLTGVATSSGGALGLGVALGVLFSLWSASSGFSNLIEAVNLAYNEDPDQRPFWKKRSLALIMTLGFLALLAGAATILTLSSALAGGSTVWLWRIGAWVAIAALMAFGIAALYRYAPDRSDAQWEWVSWGAAIALGGWLAISVAFRFYVARFGSYDETYGSLGAIVVVLLWLYLSALVVIAGALVNAEIEHQTRRDTTEEPDEPMGERGAFVADTLGATSSGS